MKKYRTDLIVIGGGSAGLATALSAASKDLRVIIIEKMPFIGGAAFPPGGNGCFAIESQMQKDMNYSLTKKDAFNYMMDFTHWRTDARIVSTFIENSAETIEWLKGLGGQFSRVAAYFSGAYYTWHMRVDESSNFNELIFNKAKQLGVEAMTGVTAKQILKTNGKISGVHAIEKNDEKIEITSKAVAVCTGGFAGNAEMIEKYTGFKLGEDVFGFGTPQLNGEGLEIAWAAGAGKSEILLDTYACMPPPFCGPGGTSLELGVFRQPNFFVNLDGERFIDESIYKNVGFFGNSIYRQKGHCAFSIFDEEINKYYEKNDWDYQLIGLPIRCNKDIAGIIHDAINGIERPKTLPPGVKMNDMPKSFKVGKGEPYPHMYICNTIEDISEKTGINREKLKRTIDEYNKACVIGKDNLFYKDAKYLRSISTPPFYVGRFYLGAYGTMGGIRINANTEVLDNNHNIIPGLYAVGNDANSLCGDTFPFMMAGNASGFCYTMGRIAGQKIAKYIK